MLRLWCRPPGRERDRGPRSAAVGELSWLFGCPGKSCGCRQAGGDRIVAGIVMQESQNHQVAETEVEIQTQDGTCNAVFFHPATGSHAAVLVWPDAFGLRASTREIGKRTAAEGYTVILPNPYYRVSRAPLPDVSQ